MGFPSLEVFENVLVLDCLHKTQGALHCQLWCQVTGGLPPRSSSPPMAYNDFSYPVISYGERHSHGTLADGHLWPSSRMKVLLESSEINKIESITLPIKIEDPWTTMNPCLLNINMTRFAHILLRWTSSVQNVFFLTAYLRVWVLWLNHFILSFFLLSSTGGHLPHKGGWNSHLEKRYSN